MQIVTQYTIVVGLICMGFLCALYFKVNPDCKDHQIMCEFYYV